MRAVLSCRRFSVLLCALAGGLAPVASHAAKWTTSAAVAPSVMYTDNVCLSNDNRQGDWVGLVTPSGSIQGKGRKADVSVRGSVQFNTLTDSQLRDSGCRGGVLGNRDQFAPDITARGRAVLIDDWMNITVVGRASQNQASPFGGRNDPLDTAGNTNNFYRYAISPEISRRLKDQANFRLRYTYDEVINSRDTVSDSTSDTVAANLSSGRSSRVSWNLLGNYRRVQYDDDPTVRRPRDDAELSSAGVGVAYRFNRRWQANATAGQEWNDFQSRSNQDNDGIFWDTGVRWTPTPRTSVAAGIGDRFFGYTPRLDAKHRHKRNDFTASYSKTITFGRDILTSGGDLNPGFNNNFANNTRSPIIDERFNLGYSYSGRSARIALTGSHSEQTEEETGLKSTYEVLALTLSPKVPRKYSLSGTLAWSQNEPRSTLGATNVVASEKYETWTSSVTLGRRLNDRMSLSLNYRYTEQQSNIAINDYHENRVMATLNISL